MKKIFLAMLLVSGFALASQAQSSDQKPAAPAAQSEAASKADAKSCCAGMTEAEKKNCKETPKAEADQKASASTAAAPSASPKSCCSEKSASKAECAGKTVAAVEPVKKEKADKK